ncbi:NB-ARC domain-containing protein [Telluribacter sp. SYSU D00476]|uniref:NB-ARC domain-containing protein n=1 Tax=Telluribacter sp. SYSU D00476 TaxID=2811430 RepID=UPI001FF40682|nr:NB-ARC domain-containing protein [Telluribacter sp. SYSU D00476]
MKTYSIFLASSYELKHERILFRDFINRENDRLIKKKVRLRLEVWEDMDDAFNTTCKQEDYNEYLRKCQLCVVLFWTKMGKYTWQEFDLAYALYKETGWPRLYVYEKTAPPTRDPLDWEKESKQAFLDQLRQPGQEQFQSPFEHYAELENRFKRSLEGLFEQDTLTYGEPAQMLSLRGAEEPTIFIGREEELKTIRERLKDSGKLMLINAEGGIGKTTLAARYWNESRYDYQYQAWIFCENGILSALKELAPQLEVELIGLDEPQQLLALKQALLKVHDGFLLVLDNANDEEDIRQFRREFEGFHWHVLITSRCQGVLEMQQELPIMHLPPDRAKELFLRYYQEESPDFDTLVDRLLRAINYHTLLVEIFAKNLSEAAELGVTLVDFLHQLESQGLYLGENSFSIQTRYTDYVRKPAATTDEILDILYDFSKLTEEQRYLLVNLALLPAQSYTMPFLIELLAPDDKKAFRSILKSLYHKGWIGGTNKTYRLSSVVQALVLEKNNETRWEDAEHLVDRLTELLKPELEKDDIIDKFKWLPYAQQLVDYLSDCKEPIYFSFLSGLALIMKSLGGRNNLLRSKGLLEKVLKFNTENLNHLPEIIATSQNNLAQALEGLGGKDNLIFAKELVDRQRKVDNCG